jgi:hypothetical protein
MKARLMRLVKRAQGGEAATSAHPGKSQLRPAQGQPEAMPRQAGQLKNKIWIADNFDEFDEELERLFYGEVE